MEQINQRHPHRVRIALFCLMILGISLTSAPRADAQAAPKAALSSTLPEVRFDNITFADGIDFLRDISGANLHVNWRALELAGIGKDSQINIRLRSVSLRKVLDLMIGQVGVGNSLSYYVDGNVLEITTREMADQQMITRVYPVGDLLMEVPDFIGPNFQIQASQGGRGGGGSGGTIFTPDQAGGAGGQNLTREQRAQQLMDTIQSIIQPDIWTTNGGRAAIRFFNDSLIVTAPRSVHDALGYHSN